MKKVLLTLVAALILTSCDGLFKAKTPDVTADNDTINSKKIIVIFLIVI